jgi:wobble nucleotide-excising tRNase
MNKDIIIETIKGFTDYIKIACQKASSNLSVWNFLQINFDRIVFLYNDYIAKEMLAANLETAAKGNREDMRPCIFFNHIEI